MFHCATINLIPKVMQSGSVIYENECAMALHKLFIPEDGVTSLKMSCVPLYTEQCPKNPSKPLSILYPSQLNKTMWLLHTKKHKFEHLHLQKEALQTANLFSKMFVFSVCHIPFLQNV
jgi:hypothetical protein